MRVTDGFTTGNVVMADAVKFVYVPPPQPPLLTNPPLGKSVTLGSNATFAVGASGTAPLSYRWRFEGTNLPGATASSYTVTNAQPFHEGDYDVVVTNVVGSVTSPPAFLIVNLPPYIGEQPQSQTLKQGSEATFFVSAGGTEPFTYQWRFFGTNLNGATASSYTRLTAQTNHAGPYSVLVSNVAGWVQSSNAMLAVTLPTPPFIQSIDLLGDGRARLVINGDTGVTCAVEGSSNLLFWFEILSAVNTNGILDLIDNSASNSSTRFYRARQ